MIKMNDPTPAQIAEIILKITGPVQPLADAAYDYHRLANLKNLGEIAVYLTDEIRIASFSADSPYGSASVVGKEALKILGRIKELTEVYNQ